MTQIDFYIVRGDTGQSRLTTACRIAEKAVQLDRRVFICPDSAAQARQLDELLWTFSQGSFVPHRLVTRTEDSVPAEPVLVGNGSAPPREPWDLLINLASRVPDYFSRYERVAEVVDGDAERRAQGRERYRFYRDRGYKLNSHQV